MSSLLVIITLSFSNVVWGFRSEISMEGKDNGALHHAITKVHYGGPDPTCDSLSEKDKRKVARDNAQVNAGIKEAEAVAARGAADTQQREADTARSTKIEEAKRLYDSAVAEAERVYAQAVSRISSQLDEAEDALAIAKSAALTAQQACDQGAKSTYLKQQAAKVSQQQEALRQAKTAQAKAEWEQSAAKARAQDASEEQNVQMAADALCQIQCADRSASADCRDSYKAIQSQSILAAASTGDHPQFTSVVCTHGTRGGFISQMANFELLEGGEPCTTGHRTLGHKISCAPGFKNSDKPALGKKEIPEAIKPGYKGLCEDKTGYCALKLLKTSGDHEASFTGAAKTYKTSTRELLFVSIATADKIDPGRNA